jgi:hypothetical protein
MSLKSVKYLEKLRGKPFPSSSIHIQKFRLKCNRKTRLKRLKKGEKQTRPKSRHLNEKNF